jgi:DNA polymerase
MLNYYGAHTGRASGGDGNLQNLPRGGVLRKSIRAPQNHTVVAVDSAQIEARVVAWLAGQDDLVEDFRNKEDIYSKFASDVYGRKITKEDKVERFVGKTCILGLGYGLGKDKFRNTLKVSTPSVELDEMEAERIVKLYRSKYSRIVDLWKEAGEALPKIVNGYDYEFGVGVKLATTPDGIKLPNGMQIRYPNLRKADDAYMYDSRKFSVKIYGGKIVENVVQGLARIIVFDQMAKIDQEFRRRDTPQSRFKVALVVHDEVVVVVPEGSAQWALEYMMEVMSTPPKWAEDLPVACEGDFAATYGDCK